MAEVQSQIDPVAGLIEVPLPREVSLWPQTWESRLAIGLLLTVAILTVWRFVHMRSVNRYRREALAELDRIEHEPGSGRSDLLSRLTVLVRRTALAAFPREQVVTRLGPAWLSFLDHSYGGHEFSDGIGRLLASGPYQRVPPDDAELQSLNGLVGRWIRRHHA